MKASDKKLIAEINSLAEETQRAENNYRGQALKIGSLLLDARKRWEDGAFGPPATRADKKWHPEMLSFKDWLKQNVNLEVTQCYRYMQIARASDPESALRAWHHRNNYDVGRVISKIRKAWGHFDSADKDKLLAFVLELAEQPDERRGDKKTKRLSSAVSAQLGSAQ